MSEVTTLQEEIYVGRSETFQVATGSTIYLNGYSLFIEGKTEIAAGARFIGSNGEEITFAKSELVLADIYFEHVQTYITSASSTLTQLTFTDYETALTLYSGIHTVTDVHFRGGGQAILYKKRSVFQVLSAIKKLAARAGFQTVHASDNSSPNRLSVFTSIFGRHTSCVIQNETAFAVDVFDSTWADGPPQDGIMPPCKKGNVTIHEKACPSVIFIPGMQGSRLYHVDAEHELEKVWEPSLTSDPSYLKLDANGQSMWPIQVGEPIDELRFLADLYTDPVYGSLIQELKRFTDQCGSEFSAFGYDWRLPIDHSETAGKLRDRIIALHELLPDRQIVLIGHSMGGLLAKHVLSEYQQITDYIEGMLFIGTPHLGTPKSFASILHGDGFTIAGGLVLTAASAREIAGRSVAALSLLPSRQFFNQASATIMYAGKKFSTSDLVRTFLTADREYTPGSLDTSIPLTLSNNLLGRADSLHERLDNFIVPAHIRTASIVGTGLPTLWGLQYRDKVEQRCGAYGAACITTTSLEHLPLFHLHGDGTVMSASAKSISGDRYLINLWDRRGNEGQKISHYNMTELEEVLVCVKHFLSKQPCELTQVDTSQRLITVGIHSPLVPVGIEAISFGDAYYISYPLDGVRYESEWRGNGFGSAEISVSVDGNKHLMVPQSFFISTSTVIRIGVQAAVQSTKIRLTVIYEPNGTTDMQVVSHYLVDGDSVILDPQAGIESKYGDTCILLEPRHWYGCFIEYVVKQKWWLLLEQEVYGRNVSTGQRQEAVTGGASSP